MKVFAAKSVATMDNRKIILTFHIFVSMVGWFLSHAALQFFHSRFYSFRRLPAIKFAQEAFPIALGVVIFLILTRHARANAFLEDVVSELRKVTWPSRDDVTKSTTVVVICIIIASFLLAGFDVVWGKVISALLKI